ncbi:MAG TPA: F0F1 ATP synthase subunit B [Saprospiraceae bacterium]|nr:F0F1 ATP synthase subunit B [Saprospiraceae bacterium]
MIFLLDFSPIKPDFGLLFWSTVIFGLFWLMIGKFAFRPIANALKKREEDIQTSLDQAKKAREEMANLKSENEELLKLAQEERQKILREAKEAKDAIVAEAREKAKDESKRIVAEAKELIENQKMAAIVDLKNQAGRMAIEIAEKIMRKDLAGDTEQEAFVKKLVDDTKLN